MILKVDAPSGLFDDAFNPAFPYAAQDQRRDHLSVAMFGNHKQAD
jgi:hypothetical protein